MKKRVYYEYSTDDIKKHILAYAKSQNMPENWAKQIADRVAKATDTWIENKDIVTDDDLRRIIYKELRTLSPDLAFAYKNRDKII